MKTILVTGAKGQLGLEVLHLKDEYNLFEFISNDLDELDITNSVAVNEFFNDNNIDYCINCAAYTAVDKAEEDRERSALVNVTGTENLAKACREHDVMLIHISTDFVFDGKKKEPYKEDDSTWPDSYYGVTKLEGEQKAMQNLDKLIIVRTSWLYSGYKSNFVQTMIKLGKERDELNVVNDQYGSPTYAPDLAKALLDMIVSIEKDEMEKGDIPLGKLGIFHYCNEGVISWYEFAKSIMKLSEIDCKINPIPTTDYPTPATRPSYSALDTTKIKTAYPNIEISNWEDSLKRCLALE